MRQIEFQRRHYQFIADIIKEMDIGKKTRKKVAQEFADRLHRTNHAFSESRFIDACKETE